MREINEIIIHCSATKPSMDIGVEEIRDWHVNGNGWQDVGYSHIIRRDGTLELGRPISIPGAHVAGRNAKSIGICLVGGIDETGRPDCNYTEAQWRTLRTLVPKLVKDYGIPLIAGHRDYSDKACPVFSVKDWASTL